MFSFLALDMLSSGVEEQQCDQSATTDEDVTALCWKVITIAGAGHDLDGTVWRQGRSGSGRACLWEAYGLRRMGV